MSDGTINVVSDDLLTAVDDDFDCDVNADTGARGGTGGEAESAAATCNKSCMELCAAWIVMISPFPHASGSASG